MNIRVMITKFFLEKISKSFLEKKDESRIKRRFYTTPKSKNQETKIRISKNIEIFYVIYNIFMIFKIFSSKFDDETIFIKSHHL